MTLTENIQRAVGAEKRGEFQVAFHEYVSCVSVICQLLKEHRDKGEGHSDAIQSLLKLFRTCSERVNRLALQCYPTTQEEMANRVHATNPFTDGPDERRVAQHASANPSAPVRSSRASARPSMVLNQDQDKRTSDWPLDMVTLEDTMRVADEPGTSKDHTSFKNTPDATVDPQLSADVYKRDMMKIAKQKNKILLESYRRQADQMGDRPEVIANLHLSVMRKVYENLELARYKTDLYDRRDKERRRLDDERIKVDDPTSTSSGDASSISAAVATDYIASLLPSLFATGEQTLTSLLQRFNFNKDEKVISYQPHFHFKMYPVDRGVRHEETFFCDRLKETPINVELVTILLQKFMTVKGHPLSSNLDDYVGYFYAHYYDAMNLMAQECGMTLPAAPLDSNNATQKMKRTSEDQETWFMSTYEACHHDAHLLLTDLQYHLFVRYPEFKGTALEACWQVVEHVIYTRLYPCFLLPMSAWFHRKKQRQLDELYNTPPYTDLLLQDLHVKSHFLLISDKSAISLNEQALEDPSYADHHSNDRQPLSKSEDSSRNQSIPSGLFQGMPASLRNPLSKPSGSSRKPSLTQPWVPSLAPKPYEKAILEMRKFHQYKTPAGKLICLANVERLICQCVSDYWREQGMTETSLAEMEPTADDLLPLTAYVLVKAKPSFLVGDLAFVENFMAENLIKGEEGFVLATVQTALQALLEHRF